MFFLTFGTYNIMMMLYHENAAPIKKIRNGRAITHIAPINDSRILSSFIIAYPQPNNRNLHQFQQGLAPGILGPLPHRPADDDRDRNGATVDGEVFGGEIDLEHPVRLVEALEDDRLAVAERPHRDVARRRVDPPHRVQAGRCGASARARRFCRALPRSAGLATGAAVAAGGATRPREDPAGRWVVVKLGGLRNEFEKRV